MQSRQDKKNVRLTKTGLMRRFLKGSMPLFSMSLLFAALTSLLDLINPRIVGMTVDSVIGSKPIILPGWTRSFLDASKIAHFLKSTPAAVPALVLIVAFLCAVCRYLFNFYTSAGSEKLVQRMRDLLFTHIEKLPFSWYSSHDTGDIIQRCTSDVETIKRFISEQLTSLLRILVLIALSLWFMGQIHVKLTLLTSLFIPAIVAYSFFFHGKIASTFERADSEEGVLSSYAQENLTGVRVVKAFGRERQQRERFAKQNDIYTDAYMKLCILLSAFWSAGDFISGIQVLTVVLLGAVFTVKGGMSTGEYISFVSYNAILVWPVRQLGRVISDMSKAGVSVERIRQIMASPEETETGKALEPDLGGDIRFSHVSFSYDKTKVLKDICLTIPGGSVCGILGGTGSGKSTLMYLLKRMYLPDPDGGFISIGGTDIRDIRADYLRRGIGLVMQEPFLFSRTIKENIMIASAGRKADENESYEEMRHAARIADLEETVDRFSDGYETFVGERGVTLSGGQKQRTAIAQTLVTHAPVLIFDDSLSAVDSETDARIQANLREATSTATVIMISHRISSLMHADKIIVLNAGAVAAEGTHRELLESCPLYARICQIQGIAGTAGKGEEVEPDEE